MCLSSEASQMSSVLRRNNVNIRSEPGPVLVYAHGFGCNQNMWDRITPAFESTHKQVLFDYVGSGKSDLSAFDVDRYANLDGYALDLLEVCDALKLESDVTFVGQSVSCSVGLLAAIQRPNLFERMVFVAPNPCFVNDPPDYYGGFERKDLQDLLALLDQNYIGWAQYLAPIVAGAPNAATVGGEWSKSFCSTDPLVARIFAEATFFSDNRSDLQKVQTPCLILQNRNDELAPLAVGDYVHKHLVHSVLEVLDVTGHCAHMSNPELVIDAMRKFISFR